MSSSAKIDANTRLEELAYIVSQALSEHDISVVLVGGAVVSIYTQNRYQSGDLDFVAPYSQQPITPVMESLGFKRQGRHYKHPRCAFTVEFPAGSLEIGERYIDPKECTELHSELGTLRLLTPTQSTMDRLAAFYRWNDYASLDQAVWIAASQDVDLDVVQEWSHREGAAKQYEVFKNALWRYAEELGLAGDEDEPQHRGPQQTR